MLLRTVSVAGFKSIKNQRLDLGRVNIFVGQNGAGKSNILEAIAMLSSAVSGGITYPSLSARGVRLSSPSVYRSALGYAHRPKYFDLSAEFEGIKYHCNIYTSDQTLTDKAAWTFHSESLSTKNARGKWEKKAGRSGNGIRIFGQPFEKTKIGSDQSIMPFLGLLGDISSDSQSALQSLEAFSIYSPFTNILRGVASDDSLKQPLGLYGGGLAEAMKEILKGRNHDEILRFFSMLPWFRGISIRKPDASLKAKHVGMGESVLAFSDRFMTNDFNKLYSADVSEGALYVSFILALMLHPSTPRLFAFDNVDSTLNPGLVKNIVQHIAELAEKCDKQVILTTHNPTALDAVDIFNPDHKIFIVERNLETGETEATNIKPPSDMTREQWNNEYGDAKLSELWLDGFLGGMTPPEQF